jgi:heterodisulfide reductase subunit A
LLTYSTLAEFSGKDGNFLAKVIKRARYIDSVKCTGCGTCVEKCPKKATNEYEMGLSERKAVYFYYPQAIPPVPCIDKENCIMLVKGKCGACKKFCLADAVDFEQKDEVVELKVGAVIVATGFSQFDAKKLPQYGYGKIKNVITGLECERLLSAGGPTGGHLVRLSDHKPAKRVAFLQCIGSRSVRNSAFCSSVCCMHSTKEAILANEHDKELESYILYTDFRAVGKGFQEYRLRAENQYGVKYIRARASDIDEAQDGSAIVRYEDGETGEKKELIVDLAVLAMSLVPAEGTTEVAEILKLELDSNGFVKTDPLCPVQTTREGIFACGYCQGPLDIPESVAQASGAAAKAAEFIANSQIASRQ